MSERIGLIAGSGQFPILFAQKARKKGLAVVCAGYQGEADPGLQIHVDVFQAMHLGQLKRLVKFFKKHRVEQAVMLGAIRKTRIFMDVKPDLKALALLAHVRHTHDDNVLRVFAQFLEREGIVVKPSTLLLPELLAKEGNWTRRRPNKAQLADIQLGWQLAKEIGRLDIGQCVVIGGGSVLAVEAIDGTDATLRRGGRLGQGTAVAVKVSKPDQDMRFDVPALGLQTVETMKTAGVQVLAIEAGRTVVFNKEEMIAAADDADIVIISKQYG